MKPMLTHEGLELATSPNARPDAHKIFRNAIPHIYENSCNSNIIISSRQFRDLSLILGYWGRLMMFYTPRSRTPSRTGTPVPGRSPSRLVIPHTLRPTHSLSNLHVHSHGSPAAIHAALPTHSTNATAQLANQELESSVSSEVNMEGILVQEVDADVDTVDGEDRDVMGYITADPGSKQNLRDQLRRTLTKRQSSRGWLGLLFLFQGFAHI
jgi:hypothetical protein